MCENAQERKKPFVAGHLAVMNASIERGDLLLGGALGSDASHLMGVFTDEAAAQAFADADPYAQNGILDDITIRPWEIAGGALKDALLPTVLPAANTMLIAAAAAELARGSPAADGQSQDVSVGTSAVLQIQPLELQLMIITSLPWDSAVMASAVCRPWFALARLAHTWGVQWYTHFGPSVAGSTKLALSYQSFRVALQTQQRVLEGNLDMVGQWTGHGEQEGYSYNLRLVLAPGEELWQTASKSTNCYLTYGCPMNPNYADRLEPGYTNRYCAMMSAGEYYTAGGPPMDTYPIQKDPKHLRDLSSEDGECIAVSGYFDWYLDAAPEDRSAYLSQLNQPGSVGREFVCGVLSNRTLQILGTHVDEPGQSSVGQDVYSLELSEDLMTMKGITRGNGNLWCHTVELSNTDVLGFQLPEAFEQTLKIAPVIPESSELNAMMASIMQKYEV